MQALLFCWEQQILRLEPLRTFVIRHAMTQDDNFSLIGVLLFRGKFHPDVYLILVCDNFGVGKAFLAEMNHGRVFR